MSRYFGVKLIELRQARGFSQQSFAETLGVTQAYVAQLESGKANPSLKTLIKLADALNVDVSDLIKDPKKYKVSTNDFWDRLSATEKEYLSKHGPAIITFVKEIEDKGVQLEKVKSVVKMLMEYEKDK